jgi:hypothetical protein
MVKVSTGWILEFYPARWAFGPSSKFIFMDAYHIPPKSDFILFQLEWSLIYLLFTLTIIPLIYF